MEQQLRGKLDEMKEKIQFLMLYMQDLGREQELLREEKTQLKARLSLVMEILGTVLRKD